MDPAGNGLYPVDPGKAPDHDVTTRETQISWLWRDSLPSVARISGRDCRFMTRLKAIRVNLMRPHARVRETTPPSGTGECPRVGSLCVLRG